ncbi:MAG: archaellin/type IV pilin N-terminal domain-containing protein [archaeon]
MKRGVRNKRGLSPVIASTLMILLVLVLAAIIFFWARGFISEQIEKFGRPVEELCSSVDFGAEKVGSELEVINRGNVDIRHLDIKLFKEGNSEIAKFDFSIDAGQAIKKTLDLKMDSGEEPEKIIIYPALIGNVRGQSLNKVFTCMDSGITL